VNEPFGFPPLPSAPGRARKPPSTLITSRRSQADFLARLVFFAVAPFGIVLATAYFPVTGALVNIAVALVLFLAGEAIRAWASTRPLVWRFLSGEFAFEAYYRARKPRPFLYYVFYPLLFPYWLIDRDARKEFWLFKGYTLASLVILLGSIAYQFFRYWRPELTLLDFAPVVGITLAIETLLVLGLLMPIATTVVGFHEVRRGRLVALLVVALVSTTVGVVRIVRRRDPVISYSTHQRVWLRSKAALKQAHAARLAALRAAWKAADDVKTGVEGDGKVEGMPLDLAHAALGQSFYKSDEAFAFDLWASPRKSPNLLVLYFGAQRGHVAVWTAMKRSGEEVIDPKLLPKGAFDAMNHAADQRE
jgi:hypothetical protein